MHGVYYVVLRGWTWLAGDSIEAVRAFSALGVGVTAAATVLLVARHQRLRTAVAAGLVTGIVPGVAWTALDGRSYAWSAAFAVLATLALENACRHRSGRGTGSCTAWSASSPAGGTSTWSCSWSLTASAVMVGLPEGPRRVDRHRGAAPRSAWRAARVDRLEPAGPGGLADLHGLLVGPDAARRAHQRPVRRPGLDPLGLPGGLLVFFALGIRAAVARRAVAGCRPCSRLWAGLPTVVAVGLRRRRGRRDAPALRHVRRPRRSRSPPPSARAACRSGRPALPRSRGLAVVAPILVAQRADDAKPDDLRRLAATRRRRTTPTRSTSPCRRRAASPPPTPSRSRAKADISAPLRPGAGPVLPRHP